ncbi:DUF5906 domain-containing protein [Endozoicomonas sp. Mp262]|uniref:primase-helicase family protein n=1 Tax=Endozoicomonas sp. Mp262 TaxID=2919499 RepID=UPI0021E015CF
MDKVISVVQQLKKPERSQADEKPSDENQEAIEFDNDPLNYVNNSRGKRQQITYEERKILEKMNGTYTHSVVSGKHVLLRTVYNPVEGESISFEPKEQFKNYFLDEDGIGGLNRGNAWLGWKGKNKKFGGVTFQPATDKAPDDVFNLFRGYRLKPKEGDCQPYLDHLKNVICCGDEKLAGCVLQFFAHMLQKPDEKPSWAILIKSVEGTGKGSLIRPFQDILGAYYIQLNGEDQLVQRFNYSVANRLLVFVDEVHISDPKVYNKVKVIISEPTITMEPKGIDVFQVPNLSRLIFTSNHDKVLLAGQRERRFLVLAPDSTFVGDDDYFKRYYRWLDDDGASHLFYYLLNLDISTFNPYKAPVTKALIDEKLGSMTNAQNWFYEKLVNDRYGNCHFPARDDATDLAREFRGWCIDHTHHNEMTLRSAQTQVGNLMRAMKVHKPRASTADEDGKRPYFYEFPAVDDLEQKFAEMLGHNREDIFS